MASISARLKFTQGALVGVPGQALFVERGIAVVCANENNANVQIWKYDLLEVPEGSSLTPGTLSNGTTPTAQFTPDVPDGYLLRCETQRLLRGKLERAIDHRVVGVRRPGSRIFVPPFSASKGALNFGGQTKGWQPYYREMVEQLAMATGYPVEVVMPASGVSITVPLFTVPASPAGPSRFLLSGVSIRVEEAPGAASDVSVTMGLNGGSGDIHTTVTVLASSVGDFYGLNTTQLGSIFQTPNYSFNAMLNASDVIEATLVGNAGPGGGRLVFRIYGTPQ